jgi:hypothetical protein
VQWLHRQINGHNALHEVLLWGITTYPLSQMLFRGKIPRGQAQHHLMDYLDLPTNPTITGSHRGYYG